MVDVARRELRSSGSPGGTKTFDLDIEYKNSLVAKESLLKEDCAEETQQTAHDNASNDSQNNGEIVHLDNIAVMRERFEKVQRKELSAAVETPSTFVAGQAFKGNFSWDNFEQTKQLSEANASLLQQLDKKDRALKQLQEQVAANAEVTGFDPVAFKGLKDVDGKFVDTTDSFKDAKIVQLVKKSRGLALLLEKERRTSSTFAAEIKGLHVALRETKQSSVETRRIKDREGKTSQETTIDLSMAEMEIRKTRKRILCFNRINGRHRSCWY